MTTRNVCAAIGGGDRKAKPNDPNDGDGGVRRAKDRGASANDGWGSWTRDAVAAKIVHGNGNVNVDGVGDFGAVAPVAVAFAVAAGDGGGAGAGDDGERVYWERN